MCADIRNEQQDPAIENRVFRNVLLKILKSDQPQRPAFCGSAGQDCQDAARGADYLPQLQPEPRRAFRRP